MDMSLSKFCELVMDREVCCGSPWGRKELDMTERLNLPTEEETIELYFFVFSLVSVQLEYCLL